MATKSLIATQYDDEIRFVYCHFDGYPEHHMPILATHYGTKEKVEALIDLGDLSSIGPKIKYLLGDSYNDFTCAYHRDKKEDWETVKPRTVKDKRGLHGAATDVEYIYLFDGDKWTWFFPDSKIVETKRWVRKCV